MLSILFCFGTEIAKSSIRRSRHKGSLLFPLSGGGMDAWARFGQRPIKGYGVRDYEKEEYSNSIEHIPKINLRCSSKLCTLSWENNCKRWESAAAYGKDVAVR